MSQAQLEQLLKPLIKPATQLILSNSLSAISASCESKFGGLPYAEINDSWCVCPNCKNELTFVAQIKQPAENSLHTFFYCFDCFPWGFGDDEKGQWLIRSYQNPDMANYVEIKPASTFEYEVTACTCAEQIVLTLPVWDALNSLSPQAVELCGKDNPYEIYDEAVNRCNCVVDYATLISGYPKWVQGETVKICPICETEMEFFAQLDSENKAELMWGDCGLVYFFRCPEHKSEFGFELQCY